ncbi:hypothetical protein BASA81_000805 [Batrachochytrium salamandrivorans]|nr:hypothetical protein BASA81_000805 [Batrachochytrium salamandrivorans]
MILFASFNFGGGGGGHPFAQRNMDMVFPFILFFSTFMIDIPMLVFPLALLVLFAGQGGGIPNLPALDLNSPVAKLVLFCLGLFWFLASNHTTDHYAPPLVQMEEDDNGGEEGTIGDGGGGDLMVFLLVVIVVCLMAQYRRQIHSRLPTALQGPFSLFVHLFFGLEDLRNGPTTQESIDALETVRVTDPGCDCAVCLETFAVEDEAKKLPCGHLFHAPCVLPWLQQKNTCPVCRKSVEDRPVFTLGIAEVWQKLSQWLWQSRDHIQVQQETRESLLRLPLKELKDRVRARGLSMSGVLDKNDLVDLLLRPPGAT